MIPLEAALSWAWERWRWFAAALAVIVLLTLWQCSRPAPTKSVVKAEQRNDKAKDQASIERRADDATISNSQQERTDAINAAPKGETGPASRALACRRWVQQHSGKTNPACQ